MAVTLETHGRSISGVQIQVEYDPAILEAVGVEPGELLGEKPAEVKSIIPIIDIDNESGTLLYADVTTGQPQVPTPSGRFATIKFRVLEGALVGGEATLRITEVKIPDESARREIPGVVINGEVMVEISP